MRPFILSRQERPAGDAVCRLGGGIGRHRALKMPRREPCGFESRPRHSYRAPLSLSGTAGRSVARAGALSCPRPRSNTLAVNEMRMRRLFVALLCALPLLAAACGDASGPSDPDLSTVEFA